MRYCHAWSLVLCLLAMSPAAGADKQTANELLTNARGARAVWKDFPGFTADVVLRVDGQQVKTTIVVDKDGDHQLATDDKAMAPWANQRIASVLSHRIPGETIAEDASYPDDQPRHLLGRKIKLEDPRMGSVYRIRGDEIREVNRNMGDLRFTISVLDVVRNEEGKYLPHVYTASFWDRKTGRLKNSVTVHHRWRRVGPFDLPASVMEVYVADGVRHVRQIEMSHHKLREASAAGR